MALIKTVLDIRDFGARGDTVVDDALAFQSAINALPSGGEVIIPRGTWTWKTVPALPRNLTNLLKITALPGSVVSATSTGKRFLDLARVADFDAFQFLELNGVVFDRGGLTDTSSTHILIGNLVGGVWSSRLNFKNINIRNCKTLNVPVSSGGSSIIYHNVSLVSFHAASSEGTQTTLTDILVEDCDFQGGNVGVSLRGDGTTITTGLGVNVYYDRIYFHRVKHDTSRVPAAQNSDGNIQVGGFAFGGSVRISDCYGANSADKGFEVDNAQDFVGEDLQCVDSWNAKYFSTNFRAPLDVNSQKNTWISCAGFNTNLDRLLSDSTDFELGGDTSTAARTFGEYNVINGSSIDTKTTIPSATTSNLSANNIQFKKYIVRGFRASMKSLAVTTGANTFVQCAIYPLNAGAVVDIDDYSLTIAGTRTGTTNNQWHIVRVDGTDAEVRISRVNFDLGGFTGVTSASDTFFPVLVGNNFASTLRLEIEGVRALSNTVAATNGVYLGTSLTIAGTAFISGLDLSRLTNGNGLDLVTNGATRSSKVKVFNTISSRSITTGGSGIYQGPQTLTANTNILYLIHGIIFANASGGAFTLTLPDAASTYPGEPFTIKRINTNGNNITIATTSSQTIDGSTTLVLSSLYETLTVISDGANWMVI